MFSRGITFICIFIAAATAITGSGPDVRARHLRTGNAGGGTGAAPQPRSDRGQAAASAVCTTPLADDAAVSRLQTLTAEEKGSMLRVAAENGNVTELQTLLAAGAKVGAEDWWERTALHFAAWKGRVPVARLLLACGASVGARNSWQETPLHVAAWRGSAAVARLLLESGANINARDENGWTPLHMAALKGKPEVATALLEEGADREATDNMGKTPLDLAKESKKQKLVKMLSVPQAAQQ